MGTTCTVLVTYLLVILAQHIIISTALPTDDASQQLREVILLLPDSDNRSFEEPSTYNLEPLDIHEQIQLDEEANDNTWIQSASRQDHPTTYKSRILKKRLSRQQRSAMSRKAVGQKRALSIFMALPGIGSMQAPASAEDQGVRFSNGRGRPLRPYGLPLRWG